VEEINQENPMTTLTILEHRYLHEIANSEYGDNNLDSDDPKDAMHDVWSFSPATNGDFGDSAGGIASSLVKKGLAVVNEYDLTDPTGDMHYTIGLTEKGVKALKSANAKFGPANDRKTDPARKKAKTTKADKQAFIEAGHDFITEAKPAPEPRKGSHPKHPKCECCGKALYKSPTKGAAVKKSDPWAFCRNGGCERSRADALLRSASADPEPPTTKKWTRSMYTD
jgi:hypothetical protein